VEEGLFSPSPLFMAHTTTLEELQHATETGETVQARSETFAEQLAERVQELQSRRSTLLADLNAVHGAIQECQRWLTLLSADSTDAS